MAVNKIDNTRHLLRKINRLVGSLSLNNFTSCFGDLDDHFQRYALMDYAIVRMFIYEVLHNKVHSKHSGDTDELSKYENAITNQAAGTPGTVNVVLDEMDPSGDLTKLILSIAPKAVLTADAVDICGVLGALEKTLNSTFVRQSPSNNQLASKVDESLFNYSLARRMFPVFQCIFSYYPLAVNLINQCPDISAFENIYNSDAKFGLHEFFKYLLSEDEQSPDYQFIANLARHDSISSCAMSFAMLVHIVRAKNAHDNTMNSWNNDEYGPEVSSDDYFNYIVRLLGISQYFQPTSTADVKDSPADVVNLVDKYNKKYTGKDTNAQVAPDRINNFYQYFEDNLDNDALSRLRILYKIVPPTVCDATFTSTPASFSGYGGPEEAFTETNKGNSKVLDTAVTLNDKTKPLASIVKNFDVVCPISGHNRLAISLALPAIFLEHNPFDSLQVDLTNSLIENIDFYALSTPKIANGKSDNKIDDSSNWSQGVRFVVVNPDPNYDSVVVEGRVNALGSIDINSTTGDSVLPNFTKETDNYLGGASLVGLPLTITIDLVFPFRIHTKHESVAVDKHFQGKISTRPFKGAESLKLFRSEKQTIADVPDDFDLIAFPEYISTRYRNSMKYMPVIKFDNESISFTPVADCTTKLQKLEAFINNVDSSKTRKKTIRHKNQKCTFVDLPLTDGFANTPLHTMSIKYHEYALAQYSQYDLGHEHQKFVTDCEPVPSTLDDSDKARVTNENHLKFSFQPKKAVKGESYTDIVDLTAVSSDSTHAEDRANVPSLSMKFTSSTGPKNKPTKPRPSFYDLQNGLYLLRLKEGTNTEMHKSEYQKIALIAPLLVSNVGLIDAMSKSFIEAVYNPPVKETTKGVGKEVHPNVIRTIHHMIYEAYSKTDYILLPRRGPSNILVPGQIEKVASDGNVSSYDHLLENKAVVSDHTMYMSSSLLGGLFGLINKFIEFASGGDHDVIHLIKSIIANDGEAREHFSSLQQVLDYATSSVICQFRINIPWTSIRGGYVDVSNDSISTTGTAGANSKMFASFILGGYANEDTSSLDRIYRRFYAVMCSQAQLNNGGPAAMHNYMSSVDTLLTTIDTNTTKSVNIYSPKLTDFPTTPYRYSMDRMCVDTDQYKANLLHCHRNENVFYPYIHSLISQAFTVPVQLNHIIDETVAAMNASGITLSLGDFCHFVNVIFNNISMLTYFLSYFSSVALNNTANSNIFDPIDSFANKSLSAVNELIKTAWSSQTNIPTQNITLYAKDLTNLKINIPLIFQENQLSKTIGKLSSLSVSYNNVKKGSKSTDNYLDVTPLNYIPGQDYIDQIGLTPTHIVSSIFTNYGPGVENKEADNATKFVHAMNRLSRSPVIFTFRYPYTSLTSSLMRFNVSKHAKLFYDQKLFYHDSCSRSFTCPNISSATIHASHPQIEQPMAPHFEERPGSYNFVQKLYNPDEIYANTKPKNLANPFEYYYFVHGKLVLTEPFITNFNDNTFMNSVFGLNPTYNNDVCSILSSTLNDTSAKKSASTPSFQLVAPAWTPYVNISGRRILCSRAYSTRYFNTSYDIYLQQLAKSNDILSSVGSFGEQSLAANIDYDTLDYEAHLSYAVNV